MTIEGFDSLMRKLSKLENSKQVLMKGMQQAVDKVQGDAKELAAVNTGQLRNTILTSIEETKDTITGKIYSNLPQAVYTEFGTGPAGRDAPKDLPPDIASEIQYKNEGWWIHESQIDAAVAEKYHFFKLETEDGIFYRTNGQKPQPFMYPAIKQNTEYITEALAASIRMELKKKG